RGEAQERSFVDGAIADDRQNRRKLIHRHHVASTRSWDGHEVEHSSKVAVRIAALADIILLRPECDGIHGQTVWSKQSDLFPIFAQLETCMEIARRAVGGRIICPDQEISARPDNRSRRQSPLLLLA